MAKVIGPVGEFPLEYRRYAYLMLMIMGDAFLAITCSRNEEMVSMAKNCFRTPLSHGNREIQSVAHACEHL